MVMKLRPRIAALLAAFSALAIALPASAQQRLPTPQPVEAVPAAEAARPALWKVADEDTTIYLFGTIHLLPKGIEWYDGAVATALYSCGPILEGIGVNITAWSYIDTLYVSILGCSASLPEPRLLADDIATELEAWVARL